MWIFDALNTKLKAAVFSGLLAAATEQRAVNRTIFIPTEFHGMLLGQVYWCIDLCSLAGLVTPLQMRRTVPPPPLLL